MCLLTPNNSCGHLQSPEDTQPEIQIPGSLLKAAPAPVSNKIHANPQPWLLCKPSGTKPFSTPESPLPNSSKCPRQHTSSPRSQLAEITHSTPPAFATAPATLAIELTATEGAQSLKHTLPDPGVLAPAASPALPVYDQPAQLGEGSSVVSPAFALDDNATYTQLAIGTSRAVMLTDQGSATFSAMVPASQQLGVMTPHTATLSAVATASVHMLASAVTPQGDTATHHNACTSQALPQALLVLCPSPPQGFIEKNQKNLPAVAENASVTVSQDQSHRNTVTESNTVLRQNMQEAPSDEVTVLEQQPPVHPNQYEFQDQLPLQPMAEIPSSTNDDEMIRPLISALIQVLDWLKPSQEACMAVQVAVNDLEGEKLRKFVNRRFQWIRWAYLKGNKPGVRELIKAELGIDV